MAAGTCLSDTWGIYRIRHRGWRGSEDSRNVLLRIGTGESWKGSCTIRKGWVFDVTSSDC